MSRKVRAFNLVWNVELSHNEVKRIRQVGGIILSESSVVGAAILASIELIRLIERIGGNNGVDITGVFGMTAE